MLIFQTFGQVVLEALASGLPVVGLDAEGTRDLVQHCETGYLLSVPSSAMSASNPSRTWPLICRDTATPIFDECAENYAGLLARAICEHDQRRIMGDKGSTEGIKGYTWWDAMEVYYLSLHLTTEC
jgi:glycosyltransferase involved in cell wall biosynthesis